MRRREAPDTGRSGPYFFLSYPHTPKFVDRDEEDPDTWAAKLYKDLCGHLFQLSSLPLADRIGFMDRELRPGHEWPLEMARALATCRVFVPLYSPRYFSIEQRQPQEYRDRTMHDVHQVLAGARPAQGDVDNPENWAKYDLIWPHLVPSGAYQCDSPDTHQLLIERVRYLGIRGEFRAALEVGERLEERWAETIGPRDRRSLDLRFQIANVLRSQGRFHAAHAQDTEILQVQQPGD